MNKLKRRYPAFIDGFEETAHEFETIEELMEIDWVKHVSEQPDFYRFSISRHKPVKDLSPSLFPVGFLMAEMKEGSKHYAIGKFMEIDDNLNLPKWEGRK